MSFINHGLQIRDIKLATDYRSAISGIANPQHQVKHGLQIRDIGLQIRDIKLVTDYRSAISGIANPQHQVKHGLQIRDIGALALVEGYQATTNPRHQVIQNKNCLLLITDCKSAISS